MNEYILPKLTFDTMKYSEKEVPLDLRWFLYQGCCAEIINNRAEMIKNGAYGKPIKKRIALVEKIYDLYNEKLVSGGSSRSLSSNLYAFIYFVRFVDISGKEFDLANVQERYMEWNDSWIYRIKIKKDIKEHSAYTILALDIV